MDRVSVASRQSRLALQQVQEVLEELQAFHPCLEFDVHSTVTTGDLDKTTSLRTMGATDFFTKEVDQFLLENKCQIAIHSAKDLPDPMHPDLDIIALTKGVDSRDVLVLREGMNVEALPAGAKIATSSQRRMEVIQELRSDLTLVDIRGNIDERLEKLFSHEVDGVVMARAALIRLQLTHLNQIFLEGPTAALQGRLAVVARKDDMKMRDLFSCLKVVK